MLKKLRQHWQSILLLILTTLFTADKAPEAFEAVQAAFTTEDTFSRTPTDPGEEDYTLVANIETGEYDTIYTDLEEQTDNENPNEKSWIVFIEVIYDNQARPDRTWLIRPYTSNGIPDLKKLKKMIPDNATATGDIAFIPQNWDTTSTD